MIKNICAVMTALCSVICLTAWSVAQSSPAADLIITNVKIWTVNKSQPRANALAIIRDRIVAVDTEEDVGRWRGPDTKVFEGQGKVLLPGFNDSHVHFASGGFQLDNVQLKDAATPGEFARRISEKARTGTKGDWVLGGDWDEQLWSPPTLPNKDLIDPLTSDVPVFVSRYDGHMALANSFALRLAGVTSRTPDPPGGQVVRDVAGNPTGLLKDAAMEYVNQIIPAPTKSRRTAAIERALAHAASLGVTSVQDMNPDYEDIAIYSGLANENKLTLRIYAAPLETKWQDQGKLGIQRAFGSTYLRIGAVKGFADGSLGSTTAYFFEPYTDAPATSGLLSDEMQPLSKMRERLVAADKAGLQLCIHAIGDRAISMILDLFNDVVTTNGSRDRRFRIEHAQHVARKDFDRFTQLKVIASVQPYHAIDDGRWAVNRIGPERIKTTYAFRTFLNHGVRLALGTDWNVAPLNPMLTVYAAVTRATLDGKNPHGWVPEQKLTVPETVEAYTMGSAYAEYQEKEKGSIETGKLADLIILDRDIFSIPPEEIARVNVDRTMVGGKWVYIRTSGETSSFGNHKIHDLFPSTYEAHRVSAN